MGSKKLLIDLENLQRIQRKYRLKCLDLQKNIYLVTLSFNVLFYNVPTSDKIKSKASGRSPPLALYYKFNQIRGVFSKLECFKIKKEQCFSSFVNMHVYAE
jgi:hypothetical protein